ncbi:hypothetical protein [Acidiluteibacter ferrifornacis]|uniref:Uncharacterized protein n=1 Tax=Acidiluteibacter ferrifornacis TaxID=2692424 RepID=A0A6N9NNQ5_9FLAO|nr:hypothetical protein [Acidiluteibacter ferrifornacis]NBG66900.1 hypothetical protein [Acidiluteibacter ferrifornacis]
MKTIYKLLVLLIIDFGLIWLFVYQIDPDPSVSISIIIYVPLVVIVNLLIAGFLFFNKNKEYSILFLINAVLSSLVMIYLYDKGIDRHQNKRLESWEFSKSDTTFSIIRWKNIAEFSMTYSLRPGSSSGLLHGKCINLKDEWILTDDSLKMKITKDGNLVGFTSISDTIKLTKIER